MAITKDQLPLELRRAGTPCYKDATDVFFARVGRDGLDQLREALIVLEGVPLLQQIIDAMPLAVSVVNEKGQTILTNRYWIERQENDADCRLGKRHGDLLGCLHIAEGPDGCGTAGNCERCGAAISLIRSRQEPGSVRCDYRLDRDTPYGRDTVDLKVSSTSIRVQGRQFSIFVVQDLPDRE
jgi:hypothetical protein